MPNVTPENIKHLATRYEEAVKHLNKTAPHSAAADAEFLQIIHKGGWTTIIDVERAAGVLDAFEHQAKAIAATHKALVDGARGALGKAAAV